MKRLPSITLARCLAQSRAMRAEALLTVTASDKARLGHMADAYDTLAVRIERGSGRFGPR